MTCIQVTSGSPPPTNATIPLASGAHKTEAECNQACKEGACCEGTSCSVKPQCQCQGAGKVFKGVGTTCATVACCNCTRFGQPPCMAFGLPAQFRVTISAAWISSFNGVWQLPLDASRSSYPSHGTSAATIYGTTTASGLPITLSMQCSLEDGAIRYYYIVSCNAFSSGGAATMFPLGFLSGSGYLLSGSQACQGQTVNEDAYRSGMPFIAVVECITNPLP